MGRADGKISIGFVADIKGIIVVDVQKILGIFVYLGISIMTDLFGDRGNIGGS